MNRPSLVTRFIATRFIALLLLLACGAVIVEWLAGGASWWQGMLALFMAMQTLSAVGKVSRYKRWSAQWQAMAEPAIASASASYREGGDDSVKQGSATTAKAPRSGWLRVVVAMLLALAIPVYVGQDVERASPALASLWLAICFCLGFRLLRRISRRGVKGGEQRSASQNREAENPFVTWVMDRPSSSPSRADTVRNLPEYSTRLLSR
jgi:hypothetical protein